jgi:hypothetical protein
MTFQRKADIIALYEELSAGYNPQFLSQILLPTGRSGQFATRDYVSANAILAELLKVGADPTTIQTKADVKKWLHPTTLFRLNMYTPCLAYRYDELKPHEQENLFTNQNWIFTHKINGVRAILVHHKGVTKFFSRNYSVDGSLPEYWNNIYQNCVAEETFAADCEISYEPDLPLTEVLEDYGIFTDSPLEACSSLLQMNQPQAVAIQKAYKEKFNKDLFVFRLITPLYFKGVDYRKRTIGEAFKIEEEFVKFCQTSGINIQPIRKVIGTKIEKELFLNQIIDVEMGEGVVAHNAQGVYCTEERRDKNVYIKIKRSVGAQAAKAGMGDTIDAWVSGYKLGTEGTANENLVAALEFSTNVLMANGEVKEHVIAFAPNLELELKKKITLFDETGKAYLDPQVYGAVGCLSGQNISYRSKRLTHPRLLDFPRFDKNKEDCIYSQQWLDSQVDYQG